MSESNYKEVSMMESWGNCGHFGVKIMMASPYTEDSGVKEACRKAIESIEEAVRAAFYANDPATQAETRDQRSRLPALFPNPVFVEEIPNGYSNDTYFGQFPWFIVTTTRGRIKIGWRKRVIFIDWSDSQIDAGSDELFKLEDTTKGDFYIHAWNYENAAEYISRLMTFDRNKTRADASGPAVG